MSGAVADPPIQPTKSLPRSRRVGLTGPPEGFNIDIPALSLDLMSSISPPIRPLRSPLRPIAKSASCDSTSTTASAPTPIASKSTRPRRPATPPSLETDDFASIVEEPHLSLIPISHHNFLASSHLFLDDTLQESQVKFDTFGQEPIPLTGSPIPLPPDDEVLSSSSSSLAQQTSQMSKRQHALLELLSSERAYASDLSLIKEVHLPLALGQLTHLGPSPSSSSRPSTSPSSSRTQSISSDSSSTSLASAPMSTEDVRIIFSNIVELAVFSDQFCELLEQAVGSVVSGGEGDDRVGALFAEIIPDLEKPYKYYINKHPAALAHLQSLPHTPPLTAYLEQTRAVASLHSHAWDLSSLLIKPVQRLLKYSLLLAAIIDETPDTHEDKENLKQARIKMEEVAHNVNEGRRRAEVVKEVLASKKKPAHSASVNLTRMKSLRHGRGSSGGADTHAEAVAVEKMHQEMKRINGFVQLLGKNVVDWAKMMSNVVVNLRAWALSFRCVIGLSVEQGSESFDAFLAVVEAHLLPMCRQLESDVNEKLLKELAHLLSTMTQPMKLLTSMDELAPLHYYLLSMNMSAKNRPAPTALLTASTNYIALRGQLAAELPIYLALLNRGLAVSVQRLDLVQFEFWKSVRDQWAELWDMLRVDGEMNAGHDETMAVWQARWFEVDEVVEMLKVTHPLRKGDFAKSGRKATATSADSLDSLSLFSLGDMVGRASVGSMGMSGVEVESCGTLDSSYQVIVSPLPSSISSTRRPRSGSNGCSNSKSRHRGASDASSRTTAQGSSSPYHNHNCNQPLHRGINVRKGSNGSSLGDVDEWTTSSTPVPSSSSYHSQSQQRHSTTTSQRSSESQSGFPLPRTKSMPLPSERTHSHSSSVSSKTLIDGPASTESCGCSNKQDTLHIDHFFLLAQDDLHRDTDRGRGLQSNLQRKLVNSPRSVSKSKLSSQSQQQQRLSSRPDLSTSPSGSVCFGDGLGDVVPVARIARPRPTPTHSHSNSSSHWRDSLDSWATKPAKYKCQVVHACQPPAPVSYFYFPFFTLKEGEVYEVLQEAGHPSIHPKLPLYVDDGEDCLLLCRDCERKVGWALASFLEPTDFICEN